MANLNHAGSFTNRPELKDQVDPDTGKKWQFMPNLLYWRDYQKDQGAAIAQTKDGRVISESPETGGYTGKPEKQSEARAGLDQLKKKAIDLTALKKKPEKSSMPDRATFIKEFVMPRMKGVDPFTVNVPQKAEQLYRKNIDKAFKQVFPDIPIGGMLTEEQQKHWQKINEQLRQHYYNWSKKENDFQKDLWGHMLAEYEKGTAEIKAKEAEAEKQSKETASERRAAEHADWIKKEEYKAKQTGQGEKQPPPVTWTTATKELKGRFGKQDPIGNIILTPELAGMHRISQKKLVKLKREGIKPLDAINQAEDFARNIESRFWQYIDAAKTKEQRKKIERTFKTKYKYIPRMRPR